MDATPLVLPFHDRIMHLSPDPFGHDMQQILLNMTQSQFVEITQESAQVILPVLQYLLETTGTYLPEAQGCSNHVKACSYPFCFVFSCRVA